MSSFTLLVLVAIAGWLVYRYYIQPQRRTTARRQRPVERRQAPQPQAAPVKPRIASTTLERDPKTGVYRPVDDE